MNDQKIFAQKLYAALPKDGNLFVSPFSLRSALGRATIGARGQTRVQMEQVLGLIGMKDEAMAAWLGNLDQSINSAQDVILATANRIYVQQGYDFVAEFLKLMERFAGLQIVDFEKQFEKVRQEVNAWVEEVTRQRIQNLLPAGSINVLTRMIIANAIYFKGKWASQFDQRNTKELSRFHVQPDQIVRVPMMYQKGDFLYYDDDTMQVLEMPYQGNRLSMVVLLPHEGVGLSRVEEVMTVNGLASLTRSLTQSRVREVHVYMPRFEMNWGTFNITPTLKSLGMFDAFDKATADFTGMETERLLFISGVYHKAFVKVDEEGSEAAAATAVVMELRGISHVKLTVFRMDRPFMFMINDNQTGEVLFMGRLMDPTK